MASSQALAEALLQDFARQLDADENHLAHARLALGPDRPQVAAHELMYALKDHFVLGALHIKNAFVAKHARAVDIDDSTQKIL